MVGINRPFSYSEKESQSNDTLLHSVEFSKIHNSDRSSNAGRPLKNSYLVNLKQWSSSPCMNWLPNTCVTFSPETQSALPMSSAIQRQI